MNQETIQITKVEDLKGKIFYTSWGYDQTNYNYFVVVGLSPTGKTALVQRAEYKHLGEEGQSYIQKPTNKGYGKKFRVKVEKPDEGYSDEWTLRGSVPYCSRDEGTHLQTLYKAEEGEIFQPTNPIYGH